ncbi:MAG: GLPGLI family protein [Bacteroidales bacterium]|jgi:GLPGLI family protein|nr:GLPGLI family protein [Bacteroidales bacterium]
MGYKLSKGLAVFFFFGLSTVFAQNSGIIHYDIQRNWAKMMAHCNYISKEERERSSYVYGSRAAWVTKASLKYNSRQTFFEYLPDEEQTRQWSSRKENHDIYRDLEKNEMLDVVTALGKEYIIKDSITCISWKVQNAMKEIAGHICMSAFYHDSIRDKDITAWFALDMPMSIGPDGYCGLPGVILELDMNEGAVVYTATAIVPASPELEITPPALKQKSKTMSLSAFQDIEKQIIKDSQKQRRPYFWGISY